MNAITKRSQKKPLEYTNAAAQPLTYQQQQFALNFTRSPKLFKKFCADENNVLINAWQKILTAEEYAACAPTTICASSIRTSMSTSTPGMRTSPVFLRKSTGSFFSNCGYAKHTASGSEPACARTAGSSARTQ